MATNVVNLDKGKAHLLVETKEPVIIPQKFQQAIASATVASAMKILATPDETFAEGISAGLERCTAEVGSRNSEGLESSWYRPI